MDRLMPTFRERRLRRMLLPTLRKMAGATSPISILDVGGATSYWQGVIGELESLNCAIMLLNKSEQEAGFDLHSRPMFSFVQGDAREIPFPDGAFNLVHSNSVIEHVGTWQDMAMFAREVRRVGKSYFIQVPYFWFPFEPHFHAPFIHWLPQQLQLRLFMRFKLGDAPRRTVDAAMQKVQYTNLLDRSQLQALFPDAAIVRERFWGLTKSLVAIRTVPG